MVSEHQLPLGEGDAFPVSSSRHCRSFLHAISPPSSLGSPKAAPEPNPWEDIKHLSRRLGQRAWL